MTVVSLLAWEDELHKMVLTFQCVQWEWPRSGVTPPPILGQCHLKKQLPADFRPWRSSTSALRPHGHAVHLHVGGGEEGLLGVATAPNLVI